MKTVNDRRAKVLGFGCYFDLTTGCMSIQGGELKNLVFTIVLMINQAYRAIVWILFFQRISLKIKVVPDEGEDIDDMNMKMSGLIEESRRM